MQQSMGDPYSTKSISQTLIDELSTAIRTVGPFGSVEVFVQNHIVTQITMRNIKKTTRDAIASGKTLHK